MPTGVILTAPGGGGALAAGTLDPGYARKAPVLLIAMLAVVAIRIHEVLPYVPMIRPALVVAVGGFIYLWSKSGHSVREFALGNPTIRLVLLYFAWCILTVPLSLWPANSIESLRAFLPAILMTVTLFLCPPRRDVLEKIHFWFILLLGGFAAGALTWGSAWRGRLEFGGMYDSNDLAALMTIGFPLAIGAMTRGAGRKRTIAAVCAGLMMFTVVAAGSRGGVLGFMAAALVLAMGLKGTKRIWVVGLMAFAMFIAWGTSSRIFQNRIRSLTNLEDDYNITSDVGRKAVWARGRGYILSNPVLGVGVGCFPVAEGASWDAQGRTGKWSTAHNAYIQAGAELGLPGGAIYILILVNGFLIAKRLSRGYRMRDGRREDRAEFVASMAGFATSAVFLSHAYFNGLFALVGLIAFTDATLRAEMQGVSPAMPNGAASPGPAQPVRHGERGGFAYGARRLPSWPNA